MTTLKPIAMSIVLACVGLAFAAEPKQFKNIESVGDFTQDFSVEEGNLKVIKQKPLHIELRTAPQPDSTLAAEAMFRAYLWGTYRTFLHTKADQVTVTVISPTAVDGHKKMSGTTTRAHALTTLQQIPGITSWNDVLTERQTWSEPMKRCMHSNFGKPGLRDCVLQTAGKN